MHHGSNHSYPILYAYIWQLEMQNELGTFYSPRTFFPNVGKWKSKECFALVFPSEVDFENLKCVLMAGFVIYVAD